MRRFENSLKVLILVGTMLAFASALGVSVLATSNNGNVSYIGEVEISGKTYFEYKITDPDGIIKKLMYRWDESKSKWVRCEHATFAPYNKACATEWRFRMKKSHAETYDHKVEIYDCAERGGGLDSSHKIPKSGPKGPQPLAIGPKGIIGAPTLTEWGLIALGVLLAGSLAWMIRRKVITRPTGA